MGQYHYGIEYLMNPDSDAIYRRLVSKAKFRHLSLLIHLNDLRNMKRAAEVMNLSQPAVSLAVSELEKLLGVTLFLRHARGVEPTQAATDIVPVARRILAAIGDGSEIVSSILNENAGYVRVAATPAAISALVQPAVERLARNYPSIHLDISEVIAADPYEAIANGTCDILCLRQQPTIPADWTFEVARQDELIVACGAQNPLAASGQATMEDLSRARWLLTRRGSVARNRFEDLAEEMQLPEQNRCGVVTHVPILTLDLLCRTDCLALLPRSVTIPWQRDGLVVELQSPATTRLPPLGILVRQEGQSRVVRRIGSELIRADI